MRSLILEASTHLEAKPPSRQPGRPLSVIPGRIVKKGDFTERGLIVGFREILAVTAITGSLGVVGLGLGVGQAQADPHWGPDIPWIPGPGDWVSDVDVWPGPGDIKNVLCPWNPPGHWTGGPHGIPCS